MITTVTDDSIIISRAYIVELAGMMGLVESHIEEMRPTIPGSVLPMLDAIDHLCRDILTAIE